MKNYTLIKVISILIFLFMVLLFFTACGESDPTQTDTGIDTSPDTTSETTGISETQITEPTGEDPVYEADYTAVKATSPVTVYGVITEGEWDNVEYICLGDYKTF